MKTAHKLIFFLVVANCVSLAQAKSPCHTLATNEFFNSSLTPIAATRENIKDAQEMMANGETFCKDLVQAIKTGKTTSDSVRSKAAQYLTEAKEAFENDGDMDKLEFAKYLHSLQIGSAKIADNPA
ncbi:hypothetical protein [Hafnia paralvei]|uniref:hypothetical protein n=1 Tax=Hafnia paralvei TaxID=546367 RepID=UPI00163B9FDF|nr:hypothetical protein [Hafnia paralvei]